MHVRPAQISVLVLFLFLNLHAQSQTVSKPQRDSVAIATVSRAVLAMGLTPTTAPLIVRLKGSVGSTPNSQAPTGTFTSVVKLTEQGYQVRNEFENSNTGVRTVFVGGNSGAALLLGHRVIQMSAHVPMLTGPSQTPVLELMRALTSPHYQVTMAQSGQVRGVAVAHVKISDETDVISVNVTPQDWYFDSTTGLPLRWEFRVPDTLNGTEKSVSAGAKEFANYQKTSGLLLPTQLTYFRDGRTVSVTTINLVELNVQVPESEFELPTEVN